MLINSKECAKILGVTSSLLCYYKNCGKLPEPAMIIGGHCYYNEDEIRNCGKLTKRCDAGKARKASAHL